MLDAPGMSVTVAKSLNRRLHALMDSDKRVVVLGEDILDPYGGAFKITQGLSSRFPDRVFATPISEAAIVGTASGLALRGFRPIVEIMFGDFLMLAADQLVNHAAKFKWMFNDQVSVPMVVRAPAGGYRGYGPTHSQSLEKHFIGVPGLWVIAPNILSDPGALLQQAVLDCDEPVVFIESKACYGKLVKHGIEGMTTRTLADADALFPTRHFTNDAGAPVDAVLFCYGGMTPLAVDAIRRLEIEEGLHLDLAVVTQVSPTPASHIRTVIDHVRPSRCIYVEESSTTGGWTSELIACVEEFRHEQRLPSMMHRRLGSAYTPIPASKALEARTLPSAAGVAAAILDCF